MDQIYRDLESIKKDITREITDSSDFKETDLALFNNGRAKRALMLLMTAAGECDFEELKPAAMALEYLQLGVLKHFQPDAATAAYGSPQANLSLITADYYYARALDLIVALQDDRLVMLLCNALSEVSEGYAWPSDTESKFLQDGFTRAAHRLGCLMAAKAEYDKDSLDMLIKEVDSVTISCSP